MSITRTMALAVLIAGIASTLHSLQAQQPGIGRTELQRHDLSIPGREVVQVRWTSTGVLRSPDTGIRAKRSSMCSRARSSTKSRAGRQ